MWRAGRPGFLWRGVLLLLPVLLLAGVGFYYLQQERVLAEADARRLGQSLAEDCAQAIGFELTQLIANPSALEVSPITLDSNGALVAVGGSISRAMIPGEDGPRPLLLFKLSHAQKLKWDAARQSVFASQPEASSRLQEFIDSAPPQDFLSLARYDLGLILARSKNAVAASELFLEVARDRQTLTEAGLPLCVLAQYQYWRLTGKNREALCSIAVEYPSLITPNILATVTNSSAQWLETWSRDESARAFYLHLRDGQINRPIKVGLFWTKWNDLDFLVLATPAAADSNQLSVACLSGESVHKNLAKWLSANPETSVPYARPEVELAGRQLLPVDEGQPRLGQYSMPLLAGPGIAISVSERLARPELVYSQARTRTRWVAALILCATGAALAGLIGSYRGFRQQIRLSEMKSNFVSSVSHELRAPIASMRLVAEGLDRGTVADDSKRKEYFGFMVQESRRLASLVDNILDFSRIEQGRKQYEFSPTDMEALVAQTVRLMRPGAAQREVELELKLGQATKSESVTCDGLAIQQALINLIDNAVKHSPGGGKVMVGFEVNGAGVKLSVEDQGPGIPAEEHEKIFERFYRRGSELRRETQGIGIGLTIVKHIVEGHGGRVVVRSDVGQGSRFTIELPNVAIPGDHE
jgi:signal transduction histidine kinase